MGCHTWFSVPYKTDKKEIIELAQKWLNTVDHVSPGHKKMYQWAIDNEIVEPVCELATFETDCNREGNDWVIYKDVTAYSVEKYNLEHGTNIDKYDYEARNAANIESYSDEPRIGGYPDKRIHSYDEMVEFMKTGHTNEYGHYDFELDETRKEMVMNGIKQFFINHPQGIITFG